MFLELVAPSARVRHSSVARINAQPYFAPYLEMQPSILIDLPHFNLKEGGALQIECL